MMEQMSVFEIAKALNAEYHGEDVAIDHISTDSRDLSGNCLFVALEGERTDGKAHGVIGERSDVFRAGALSDEREAPYDRRQEQDECAYYFFGFHFLTSGGPTVRSPAPFGARI